MNARSRARALTVLGLVAAALTSGARGADRYPNDCDLAGTRAPGSIAEEPRKLVGDPALVPAVTRHTDEVIALVREALPGAQGIAAHYTRGMADAPFVKDGPQKYGVRMLVYHYDCNHDTNRVVLNDGSLKTVLQITANYPGNLSPNAYGGGYPAGDLFQHIDRLRIDDRMRNVYWTQPLIGTWHGMPVYGAGFFDDRLTARYPVDRGIVSVVVARPNESPFLAVTRGQFVRARLDKLATDHAEEVARYTRSHSADDTMARLESEYQQRQAFLEQQLAGMSAADQQRPALFKGGINDSGTHIGGGRLQFPATYFTDEPLGAGAIWIANRDYWRTGQNKAAPQLWVVSLSYERGDVGSSAFAAALREHFPVEKLQALIDR